MGAVVPLRPANPVLIPDHILEEAFKNPDGKMTALSKFVFYRTYSRWREEVGRREYWAETCQRSVEFNVNLAIAHLERKGTLTEAIREEHRQELVEFYLNQYNLKQALSGRSLFVGGTPVSYSNPMSNYNCSFMVMNAWEKLGELFYLGMIGAGVGFRILFRDVAEMAPIKYVPYLMHVPITTLPPGRREEATRIFPLDRHERKMMITVGDSKEGWRDALLSYINVLTGVYGRVEEVHINYDHIRPAGERLKTYGGRAGGPAPFKAMMEKIHAIITGSLSGDYPDVVDGLLPIHLLDIANAVADNIKSGGVRDIALIALLDERDKSTIEAKSDIFGNPLMLHRFTSNNSIFYEEYPGDKQIDWQFSVLEGMGEPCFVNAKVARIRRVDFEGVNPCVEILLADRGMCNLTTTNVMAFVEWRRNRRGRMRARLDGRGLLRAQELSARAGLRMTLPEMELPEWDKIQQRDRLLGVSLTGVQDAFDALGLVKKQIVRLLRRLKRVAREAANAYADLLGVNRPLLVTTIKPEGTLSQLFGGVSAGMHVSHAPDFIRRVRAPRTDAVARSTFDLGWRIHSDSNDGSRIDQVMDIAQYLDGIDRTCMLTVDKYQYHLGLLEIEFECSLTDAFSMDQWHRMLRTYFDTEQVGVTMDVAGPYSKKVVITVVHPTYEATFGHSKKIVVDFPISTPAKRTKYNFGAVDQLEMYRVFLNHYVEHNASNTISVRPHEWVEVREWIKANWDDFLAVSFLGLDDTPYPLTPYEATTKTDVDYLRSTMGDFDVTVLRQYDTGEDAVLEVNCKDGACASR